MIARVIEFSVRNRWFVILAWLGVALWGVYATLHTPVDAIPDLSENQVIVFADWPGRSPQDIEEQVTYPLSVQLQGLAGVKSVRSSSEPNFSMITVIFDDKTDFYFARTRVLERLSTAAAQLPAGVTPVMAPDATALGQIYWYTVEGDGRSIDELRAIQDFNVRYQLASVPGVAEVASVGGFVREYQVDVDPAKLRLYDLPLSAVYSAIASSNLSVGGKVVAANNTEYLVRGVGWLAGVRDLEEVAVVSRAGVPVRLKDLATVQVGPAFRRNALEKDGREAVGGVVMMRLGENPLKVTEAIKQKTRAMQSGLPEGVRVVPFYDRTRLIESAIHTVTGTLREEMIIASIAVLLILSHFRSAVVVCVTLPLAVLVSFLFMYYTGVPSNIMSLSGIAISIGILVDAAVVTVENATHELKERFGNERVRGDTTEAVVKACRLVGRPIFFSVLIMLLSFLPVFSFTGQEGKLAHPLAWTKTFAMVGVALLAITLVPALVPLFIRGRLRGEEENWIVRGFIHVYRPLLAWAIDRPAVVWWAMAVILALGAGFVGSPLVSSVVLALGVVALVLAVRRTGWTIWLLAGLVIAAFVATAAHDSGLDLYAGLSYPLKRAMPWIILGVIGALTLLALALHHFRTAAIASLLAVTFVADTRFAKLGGEFMPQLDEGSIMDMPVTAPRIAMSQAVDDVRVRDRLLRSFPEVGQVAGKVGRAETATDPSPVDMVETIVSLHPVEWWPRRKLRFEDAVNEAANAAEEMTRRGWLKPADWRGAARAVNDADFAKQNPQLATASGLLNTAAQISVEKFDRSMRDLAKRRQLEHRGNVAEHLVRAVYDALLAHARELPARDGKPVLLRQPTDEDAGQILPEQHARGLLLYDVPRQEEVDRLLASLRTRLVARGVLADRDDLLLDHPGLLRRGADFVGRALGAEPAGFAERMLALVERERDRLVRERAKPLDWELFDYGKVALSDLLLDGLYRSALGTPLAGNAPSADAGGLAQVRASLADGIGRRIFLWRKTREDLVREMDTELQMPGWGNVWTQPIINRVNMLASGVRTQIGVKVFGPTGKPLNEAVADVERVSRQIAERLKAVPGAADVAYDQATGKRYVEVYVDREKAARYGVNVADVSQAVETAMGGGRVTMTIEGRQRFPVQLRYARDYWQDIDALKNILVTGSTSPAALALPGAAKSAEPPAEAASSQMVQVPLSAVAEVRVVDGPSMIKSENGRLRNYVTLNVRGRDLIGFVDEARQAVADIERQLAGTGMSVEWSGEFEAQVRARRTLAVIFPLVIGLILLILYVTFRDAQDMLLMVLAVPGALSGAVMFQALFGFPFSVVVSIGYVAAFGMATQTGVIMLVYLREAVERRGGLTGIRSLAELRQAVIDGAVHRLRPKLLTEGVAIVGLVPMLWATGTGAEIMRPMAAPVLGGLLISDEVIDLMIPVLFYWIRRRRWLRLHGEPEPASADGDAGPAEEGSKMTPDRTPVLAGA